MDIGQKLALTLGVGRFHSQFSIEGAVEEGGEQGVQLGGGLGLQALERVHVRTKWQ
jgi:hypothetical protein